jgi:hypothetical protein
MLRQKLDREILAESNKKSEHYNWYTFSTIDAYKTCSHTSNDLYNDGVKEKVFMFLYIMAHLFFFLLYFLTINEN